jgi:hypothetical protein
MKKIITLVFLAVTLSVKSQQTDILYIPNQNSLVASYNFKQVGLYVGGYYTTLFPQPYTYTTPLSIMNRLGLSYVDKSNSFSIMAGTFIENRQIDLELIPDVWVKLYPIRMISRNKKTLDFSLGLNYSKGFRYGVGLSIPF